MTQLLAIPAVDLLTAWTWVAELGVDRSRFPTAQQTPVIAYAIVRDQRVFREEGGDFFEQLNPQRTLKRLSQRAARLGFAAEFEAIGAKLPPHPPKEKGEDRGRAQRPRS